MYSAGGHKITDEIKSFLSKCNIYIRFSPRFSTYLFHPTEYFCIKKFKMSWLIMWRQSEDVNGSRRGVE